MKIPFIVTSLEGNYVKLKQEIIRDKCCCIVNNVTHRIKKINTCNYFIIIIGKNNLNVDETNLWKCNEV